MYLHVTIEIHVLKVACSVIFCVLAQPNAAEVRYFTAKVWRAEDSDND